VERYDPSLVIIIPREATSSMLGNSERDPGGAGTGPSLLGPNTNPNRGQLRSLDGSGQ
jgi:hypothetical protein